MLNGFEFNSTEINAGKIVPIYASSDVAAYANGYGLAITQVNGSSRVSAYADSYALAIGVRNGSGHLYAYATITGINAVFAIATAQGTASAIRNATSNINAVATVNASAFKIVTSTSIIFARATALAVISIRTANSSSSVMALATAYGRGLSNFQRPAPFERTVMVKAVGPRIVMTNQELRTIRVTA